MTWQATSNYPPAVTSHSIAHLHARLQPLGQLLLPFLYLVMLGSREALSCSLTVTDIFRAGDAGLTPQDDTQFAAKNKHIFA